MSNQNRPTGPNVKKLIVRRMSQMAIPPKGDVMGGISFLTNPERIKQTAREATQWVFDAIDAVKTAPDNPYGDNDEEIAAQIVREIESRVQRTRKDVQGSG